MKLYAGIDGGQSSTTAIIGDETGKILGRGISGPADEVAQDAGSTRLRDALEGALAKALAKAELPQESQFESIVAGISGYDGAVRGQAPRFKTQHICLLHDAPIAHAGAFDGKAGILVIAGTGSVAYGMDANGNEATVGAWGYLFGDEGSAFWISRTALNQALALEDSGKTDDQLVQNVRAQFSASSVRDITRSYYKKELTRDAIAAYAKHVITLAEHGNERCIKIARSATEELRLLAIACAKRLGSNKSEVAFVGGLLQNEWFLQSIDAKLTMRRILPRHEPAWGALLLARKYAG